MCARFSDQRRSPAVRGAAPIWKTAPASTARKEMGVGDIQSPGAFSAISASRAPYQAP